MVTRHHDEFFQKTTPRVFSQKATDKIKPIVDRSSTDTPVKPDCKPKVVIFATRLAQRVFRFGKSCAIHSCRWSQASPPRSFTLYVLLPVSLTRPLHSHCCTSYSVYSVKLCTSASENHRPFFRFFLAVGFVSSRLGLGSPSPFSKVSTLSAGAPIMISPPPRDVSNVADGC